MLLASYGLYLNKELQYAHDFCKLSKNNNIYKKLNNILIVLSREKCILSVKDEAKVSKMRVYTNIF